MTTQTDISFMSLTSRPCVVSKYFLFGNAMKSVSKIFSRKKYLLVEENFNINGKNISLNDPITYSSASE